MKRRFLVPEVIQSSAMDCGPAALKALLAGFDIHLSLGRLREACQTSVDGTSIDTLEVLSGQLGLKTVQLLVPEDHVFEPSLAALPAIGVVSSGSGGSHFVVAWRRKGPFIQLMDPMAGRQWTTVAAFRRQLYRHEMTMDPAFWKRWSAGPHILKPLMARLQALGMGEEEALVAVASAVRDPQLLPLPALDAVCRLVTELIASDAAKPGSQAVALLESLYDKVLSGQDGLVPEHCWFAKPAVDGQSVRVRGHVLLSVRDRSEQAVDPGETDLAAALLEPEAGTAPALWSFLRDEGVLTPALIVVSLLFAGLGVQLEALLFRTLIDIQERLVAPEQRLTALAMVAFPPLVLMALGYPTMHLVFRLGRTLETKVRLAFHLKIPRLADRYFSSRLTSDMAERGHGIHLLRDLPALVRDGLETGFSLLFTALAVLWLDPASLPALLVMIAAAFLIPWAAKPHLQETDLRVASQQGALSRFYLDALLGILPVRTHGAEASVRGEHEHLLTAWSRASYQLMTAAVALYAVQAVVALLLAAWIIQSYLARHPSGASALLLIYWTLRLPASADALAKLMQAWPRIRSQAVRTFEPLDAPEEPETEAPPSTGGIAVQLRDVDVVIAGHAVLHGVNLALKPGERVAVVGASGSGKSTLIGLLLGWYPPHSGEVLVNGQPMDPAVCRRLRRRCAWVDPSVQLWNRSLLHNLTYGSEDADVSVDQALARADLYDVLDGLSMGMQTHLGEGGGLLSGGEGMRVRLARAFMRPDVGLVLLDEAFRGLERPRRSAMMARCREFWADATLVNVTHDIESALDFDRVLVIHEGRLVEDDHPKTLAERSASRFYALLAAERRIDLRGERTRDWRRLHLVDGTLREGGGGA